MATQTCVLSHQQISAQIRDARRQFKQIPWNGYFSKNLALLYEELPHHGGVWGGWGDAANISFRWQLLWLRGPRPLLVQFLLLSTFFKVITDFRISRGLMLNRQAIFAFWKLLEGIQRSSKNWCCTICPSMTGTRVVLPHFRHSYVLKLFKWSSFLIYNAVFSYCKATNSSFIPVYRTIWHAVI